MKKSISALLATVLVLIFAAFALASSSSDDKDATQAADSAQAAADANQTLGNYAIEIKSARVAEDYEGKPVVIILYGFTNNASSATSFMSAFDDNVYQNDVGLNESIFVDDSANYDESNQTKEIKTGATLDVEVAYELNDTETDVEVEVGEFISLNDKVISKTFTIK